MGCNVFSRHHKPILLSVSNRLDFNRIRDGKEGEFADALAPHHGAVISGSLPRCRLAAFITDVEVFLVNIGFAHAVPIVGDGNFIVRDFNIDVRGIGIPGICNDFRQHCGDIAVKFEAEMVEDVEVDVHLILAFIHGWVGINPLWGDMPLSSTCF